MRSLFLVPILMLASAAVARGDVVMVIDLDTSTPGIQNTINVDIGDTITAGVSIQVISPVRGGLSAYAVSVLFDSDKLNLGPKTLTIDNPLPPFEPILVNRVATPPNNFSTLGDQTDAANMEGGVADPGLPIFFTNTGAFYNVAAGASKGGIGGSPPEMIFEFTLAAAQAGTISADFAGDPTVFLAVAQPSDGFLDAFNEPIPFTQVQGVAFADTTAVPEPSTLAFLGLGSLYVVRRRRKKKNNATSVKG